MSCFFCCNTADKAASSHRNSQGAEWQLGMVPCSSDVVTVPSCWTAPTLPGDGMDVSHPAPETAEGMRGNQQLCEPSAELRCGAGFRRVGMEVACGRRERREAPPLPGRAGRGSARGDTARCGCCSTRSSAAPPRRVATPRSWHWCCPPCCGRFQRPLPASCTLPGQLARLLPEHLQRAERGSGDETGIAAATNPLLEERETPHGSHTFFLLLPPLQLPPWTEPRCIEEPPGKGCCSLQQQS